jgi:hypothetical protein
VKTEESKMITAKEYSEMRNVHYTTVMNWLRRDLARGPIKEEPPFLPKMDGRRRASKKSAKKGVRAKWTH